MTSLERREQIREILITSKDPISATALAGRFSVSRQVIVGDIALLRAAGCSIISTSFPRTNTFAADASNATLLIITVLSLR